MRWYLSSRIKTGFCSLQLLFSFSSHLLNILIPHLICIGSAEPSCPVDMCVGPIRISKCWISPVPWAGAVVLHCISYSCCFESMSAQWADVNLMERSRKEPKTLAFSKEQKPLVTQNSIPDQSFRHKEQQDCPFSNESFIFWPAKNAHIHTLIVSCPPSFESALLYHWNPQNTKTTLVTSCEQLAITRPGLGKATDTADTHESVDDQPGPIRCRAPNLEEFIVCPCKSCKFLYLPFNIL